MAPRSLAQKKFDPKEMSRIFTNAQYPNKVSDCVDDMVKMYETYPNDVLMKCLANNLMITLTYPEDSPHRKHLFEFITNFLCKVTNKQLEKEAEKMKEWEKRNAKHKSKIPTEDSNSSEDESEETDELTSFKKSTKKGGKKKSTKKAPPRKKWKPEPEPPAEETILDMVAIEVFCKALKCEKLENTTASVTTVRINTCRLVRLCFAKITLVLPQVFEKLKTCLLDQMANKNHAVRVEGVKALLRFQEADNDIVSNAFIFHLCNDPDFKVRQAILTTITPSEFNISQIVARIQDVKDIVRKAAYTLIANKIRMSTLSYEHRQMIIREGLNDRSPSVKKVVEKQLIVEWLKQCDDYVSSIENPEDNQDKIGLVRLLSLLNESDSRIVDQLLKCIFDLYMSQKQDGKTKLHLFVEKFKFHFLDGRRLLINCPLTVENTSIWCGLIHFCKTSANDLEPLMNTSVGDENDENYEKEIDELFKKIELNRISERAKNKEIDETADPAEPTEEDGPTPAKKSKGTPPQELEVDLIDLILPHLPEMCYFLKKLAKHIDNTDFDDDPDTLFDYSFIYGQLVKILKEIDVVGTNHKNILMEAFKEIVRLPTLTSKLPDAIVPLVDVLATNVFPNSEGELLKFCQDLINDIYNSVFEAEVVEVLPDGAKPPVFTPAEVQQIEMDYARISLELEDLNDEFERLKANDQFMEANDVFQKKQQKKLEREELYHRRQIARGEIAIIEDPSSSSQQTGSSQEESQQTNSVQFEKHPLKLQKCVQILYGCLRFGDFTTLPPSVLTLIDKIVTPGLIVDEDFVRRDCVLCLGACCQLSQTLTDKYTIVIRSQIDVHYDNPAVKIPALTILFDLLCEHGDQGTTSGTSNEESLRDQSTMNEENENDWLKDLIQNVIIPQFKSNCQESILATVKGVTKLLFIGTLSSPFMLAKLILLWYHPESSIEVKSYLGSWFPLFAMANARTGISVTGQMAFEEALDSTIDIAAKMMCKSEEDLDTDEFQLAPPKLDNIVSFIVNLLSQDVQVRIALNSCNKILDLAQLIAPKRNVNDLEEEIRKVQLHKVRAYSKCLSLLNIDTATKGQLKDLFQLLTKVITRWMPGWAESDKKKIEKVKEKVNEYLKELKDEGNLSQLSSGDMTTPRRSSLANQSSRSDRTLVNGDATQDQENQDENDEDNDNDGKEVDINDYSFLSQGSQDGLVSMETGE